mgnify:CR=1 FL=1
MNFVSECMVISAPNSFGVIESGENVNEANALGDQAVADYLNNQNESDENVELAGLTDEEKSEIYSVAYNQAIGEGSTVSDARRAGADAVEAAGGGKNVSLYYADVSERSLEIAVRFLDKLGLQATPILLPKGLEL